MRSSSLTLDEYIQAFKNDHYDALEPFMKEPLLLTDSRYRKVLRMILVMLNDKISQGGVIPNWEPQYRVAIENLIERTKISVDSLDLDAKKQPFPPEKRISFLIKSLRDNYIAYGEMMAKKAQTGEVDDTFVALPLIPIPPMKPNSPYAGWDKFVRKTRDFFDSHTDSREDCIRELMALEQTLSEAKEASPGKALDTLLEEILEDFEKKAGFSSLVEIPKTDQVLSPDQFNTILREGHPFNDYGASVQHGKWAHRVQLYILGHYLKKNIDCFFDTADSGWKEKLGLKEGEVFNIDTILSTFYRLLGTKEFVNAFEWRKFRTDRDDFNVKNNPGKTVNVRFNPSAMWPQLFDRMGYAGYFSVPSSLGFLQQLGCFANLPVIGVPNVVGEKRDKHLKKVLDVTPTLEQKKQDAQAKSAVHHHSVAGSLFAAEKIPDASKRKSKQKDQVTKHPKS